MKEMSEIAIYCDGACSGNPGAGGWGAVVICDGIVLASLSGHEPETTNNRMELMGAISGLRWVYALAQEDATALRNDCENMSVTVFTDSMYLKNGITIWINDWKRLNWKKKSGGAVKNIDLWQILDEEFCAMRVVWHWVRGHSGDKYNEMADELARSGVSGGAK